MTNINGKLFVRYVSNPKVWVEVKEINLGSINNPKPEILEIKLITSPNDSFIDKLMRGEL